MGNCRFLVSVVFSLLMLGGSLYGQSGIAGETTVPTDSTVVEKELSASKPNKTVDEMARFGKEKPMSFRAWIYENLKWPAEYRKGRKKHNPEGRVVAKFTVNPDGSISDIKILSSPDGVDGPFAREVVRVLEMSPRWEPGKSAGEPVKVSYTMPIDFRPQ